MAGPLASGGRLKKKPRCGGLALGLEGGGGLAVVIARCGGLAVGLEGGGGLAVGLDGGGGLAVGFAGVVGSRWVSGVVVDRTRFCGRPLYFVYACACICSWHDLAVHVHIECLSGDIAAICVPLRKQT